MGDQVRNRKPPPTTQNQRNANGLFEDRDIDHLLSDGNLSQSNGSDRSSSTLKFQDQKGQLLNLKRKRRIEVLAVMILTFLAVLTRFYSLHYPDEVVFDEVHFGKFGSYYIRRSYYFDVHPPLGKMLVGLGAWLRNYNGSYLFDKIGDSYAAHDVPYVAMRSVPALLGSAIVPLVFKILIETQHSLPASILGAGMVLLDTALTTQCRFILLDAYLLFFDVLAVLGWVKFYQQRHQTYSRKWWQWLVVTGGCIALTTSVKLVGLFVVALVGTSTLMDLWRIIDIRRGRSTTQCIKELTARAVGLIAVPVTVYLYVYAVHFAVLSKSGPGDSFMTPEFQATLNGNRFNKETKQVLYNDTITILHYKTNAYLHSHVDRYPLRYEDDRVSSQGQQVTGYPHEDSNNHWRLIPVNVSTTDGQVHNGDVVQLFHVFTKRHLLTHDVASPLTPTHQEVTAVNISDKDVVKRIPETKWRVDFLDKASTGKQAAMSTIDTKFKLIHMPTKVALNCHKGKLPEWGYGQQEVNGNKNTKEDSNTWIVDTVKSPLAKTVRSSVSTSKVGLLRKFVELQAVQMRENSGLVASHPFQSRPESWPFLMRGISFWIKEPNKQVYLIGNPVIWWLGIFCVLLHCCLMLVDSIMVRRGVSDHLSFEWRRRLNFTGGFFVIGWALHYLPFFIMGRALFLHHYLPALIFTFMVTANVFDFATRDQSMRVKCAVVAALLTVFAISFYHFAPFTYGWPLAQQEIENRRWLSSWDYSYGRKD